MGFGISIKCWLPEFCVPLVRSIALRTAIAALGLFQSSTHWSETEEASIGDRKLAILSMGCSNVPGMVR
ncbi:hypothetical protein NDI49_08380 [Trichocoleus sp. ST-U3]|uniref:hypothetical protein n=1 Tax=Coleofasciculus sp. FACHB-542 TaxID=2692787 RepID=UPI001682D05F|nr:hypothetical protein [Coleofasciculus sp. FACHB-542]MBD2087557.1 hypothetical protein [Coleofasciculus sp. FACHB-542]